MLRKMLLLTLAVTLAPLLTASRAHAWGAFHVGFTHVGPYGVQHWGRTAAVGPYGAYAGGRSIGYGAYGGAYRAGYGGAAYGGYHYGAGAYGGYHYGGFGYGGVYGGAYRAGYYRAW